MVLISVLMASYNHGEFISEAIESVLNQTFKDFELIVIDDYSKDNSREIIKKYKEKDDRIKIRFHDENKGPAKTLGECIGMAEGKFIAVINSDDVWVKMKLEKQLKILKINENLIVYSSRALIDSKGMPLKDPHYSSKNDYTENIFTKFLLGKAYIFFSSIIFKREHLEDIRFHEICNFCTDYLIEIELAQKYTYYYISEPLAKKRVHGKSILSTIKNGTILKEMSKIRTYFLKKYSNAIPKKIKSSINLRLGLEYLKYGEKKEARSYFCSAIVNNPLDVKNFWFLVESFVNWDNLRRFLSKIYYIILKRDEYLNVYSVRTFN